MSEGPAGRMLTDSVVEEEFELKEEEPWYDKQDLEHGTVCASSLSVSHGQCQLEERQSKTTVCINAPHQPPGGRGGSCTAGLCVRRGWGGGGNRSRGGVIRPGR